MEVNKQPDGILLTLIRYLLNVSAIVGGLVLLGGLLFIMVTRAKPVPQAKEGQEQVVQAQATPAPTPTQAPAREAPAGASSEVIAMGKQLFQDQGCVACHTIQGVSQGVVGPDLTDIGVRAPELAQEAGVADAEAYVRQSIVEPNAFITPQCPTGPCPPGIMPATFGKTLSEEQINALVQFLLAQKGGG